MDVNLNKLNIDKSTWTLVKFGEIASEPKENMKDIQAEGIEHVVGLEHIDSEDIHLRRSANIETSTTFTKKFKKGDVLFGRRRAYLKKAAQASFSGICSGDITVFRAKKSVLPELLPFIVCNDKFFDYAVKHSAGGLSPRVKFKDLANYQFLLPPKDQQKQMAELLWAIDDVIEKELVLFNSVKTVKESIFKEFRKGNNSWSKYKLKDLCDFNYGKALKESERNTGEYPVVSSSGIQGYHDEYFCKGPGIVVGRKGNVGEVTWIEQNFWTIDTAYFIDIKNDFKHLPLKFFYYLLISANLKKHSIATAVPGLNRDDALLTPVFFPSLSEINDYLVKFTVVEQRIENIDSKIASSQALRKSLINQIF